jgi:hypothetical protein
MDSENIIIPFCLYSNTKNSYIGLPEKVYRDEKISYNCPPHPKMQLVTVFYAINPDVKPNPTYADLLCVKNVNGETTDISTLYDPFNMDINCTRFLAWLEQTPETLRLHISKNGDNIYISPNDEIPNGYERHSIPNIHVLPANNLDPYNIPKFTFSNSHGKCIPDLQSDLSITECIVIYNKNVTRPEFVDKYPNILTYLDVRYGDSKEIKIPSIIGFIFACLLCICLVLLAIKMKK